MKLTSMLLAATSVVSLSSEAFAQWGNYRWQRDTGIPGASCWDRPSEGRRCSRPGVQCYSGREIWGCDDFDGDRRATWWFKFDIPYRCNDRVRDGSRCSRQGELCTNTRDNWIYACR